MVDAFLFEDSQQKSMDKLVQGRKRALFVNTLTF